MQGLTREQKAMIDQSMPALGAKGSGKSAGDIIDSLFKLGGTIVTYTSNATPDTQDTVNHGLGYVPNGFIVIGKDKAGIVYKGAASDANSLFLKCNIATVAVTLLVF